MDLGRDGISLELRHLSEGIPLPIPGYTLITGASGGIGLEVLQHLLKSGESRVFCQYRSSSEELRAVLERYDLDPQEHMCRADMTVESDVLALKEYVRDRAGTLWGLVNLMGRSSNAMIWKTSLAEFRSIFEDNVVTMFLASREFIPQMREASGGRIINVSSVVANIGAVGAAHYAAAKAAVNGFTKSMSMELVNKGITANTIALGYFEHGMIKSIPENILSEIVGRIPMRRLGRGSEVGALVTYLLSEESEYLTGQTLHINGGQYL